MGEALREVRLALLGGRRQLQGHQGLHRPRQGAGRGRRGDALAHPGPAGGEDRPRGAHRAPGGRVPQAGPGGPAARGLDAGGSPGLRQDHHRGQAGPAPQEPGPPALSGARGRAAPRGHRAAQAPGRGLSGWRCIPASRARTRWPSPPRPWRRPTPRATTR